MIIGIDPGMNGGVAMLTNEGQFIGGIRMPVVQASPKRKVIDLRALYSWVTEARPVAMEGLIRQVVIEQVHSMTKQGVKSTFTFGCATGAVEAWAVDLKAPIHWVTPALWKRHMSLGKEKQASLDKARLSFGGSKLWEVKANDGIAEAALIALYWQRYVR